MKLKLSTKVWREIAKIRKLGVNTKDLEDAFCDYQMAVNESQK